MNLLDARKKLLVLISEYERQVNITGISLKGSVDFLTRDFDSCSYDSKKLAFISADITIKAAEAPDDESLIYALLLDAKCGGDIDEDKLQHEICDFKTEIDRIVADICFAPDPKSFIEEELKKEAANSDKALEKFEESLNRFTKYMFIAGTVVILLIAGIAGLLAKIL